MNVDRRTALAIGLVIGLVVGLGMATIGGPSAQSAAAPRAEGVPEDARWTEAFGQERWVHCAAAKEQIRCLAFAPTGTEVLSAVYVPRRDAAPKQPFTEVLARDVERVWINKVAMVPHGEVSFPHADVTIRYDKGRRLSAPAP